MKIGIDLDNTIISYDIAFQIAASNLGLISNGCKYTKQEISKKIKNRENGEIEWQQLQGYVYGKGIKEAHIFPGVYRFLWRCYKKGITVEIVSHKTEYGHFDAEKYPLRQAAIKFLQKNKILQSDISLIDNITFSDTQIDKLNYIANNNFDYFIDDLEEIVKSKQLTNVKAILFNGKNGYSWDEINRFILKSWTKVELLQAVEKTLPRQNFSLLERVKGRGNSEIDKILVNNKICISKIYPQSGGWNRMATEYNSLKLLKDLSVPYLQTPVDYDKDLDIAIYDYIKGEKVYNYGSEDVKQMLSLLSELNTTRVRNKFSNFNLASNACLSGLDIEVQIENRLRNLEDAINTHMQLKLFIQDKFIPAFHKVLIWSKKNWPNSYTQKLPRTDQILSPSDFGFHNSIRVKSGKIFFHDFEYFGWDDPVKLIADTSHHAAFDFSMECENLWVSGCLEVYGKSILNRYRAAWPLYGLIWCLIILNEYNKSIWNRRVTVNSTLKNKKKCILLSQLDKANKQLDKVLDRYDKI
jgi:hypothetical protein